MVEDVWFFEFLEEAVEVAGPFFGLGELGDGGDVAEGGVGDDLFDLFGGGLGGAGGEVERGDLEALEEEAGAARVDAVVGDAAEDLADGGLDGGAVFGEGQVEAGAAALALLNLADGDRLAGGVVVVAELFGAEAWAAAAFSADVDVAALETFWVFGGMRHLRCGLPWPVFVAKIFDSDTLGSDHGLDRGGLTAKARLVGRAFVGLSLSIVEDGGEWVCQVILIGKMFGL